MTVNILRASWDENTFLKNCVFQFIHFLIPWLQVSLASLQLSFQFPHISCWGRESSVRGDLPMFYRVRFLTVWSVILKGYHLLNFESWLNVYGSRVLGPSVILVKCNSLKFTFLLYFNSALGITNFIGYLE